MIGFLLIHFFTNIKNHTQLKFYAQKITTNVKNKKDNSTHKPPNVQSSNECKCVGHKKLLMARTKENFPSKGWIDVLVIVVLKT